MICLNIGWEEQAVHHLGQLGHDVLWSSMIMCDTPMVEDVGKLLLSPGRFVKHIAEDHLLVLLAASRGKGSVQEEDHQW